MQTSHETPVPTARARALSWKRFPEHPERTLGAVLWVGLLAVLLALSAQG